MTEIKLLIENFLKENKKGIYTEKPHDEIEIRLKNSGDVE